VTKRPRSLRSSPTSRRWSSSTTANISFDETAEFVDAFLTTKSPAKILATSREAFDIDGEQTIVLGSLPTDTADSPGVRLFVDRARAVQSEFALTDTNSATVSAICARLDGMPLAIELAAARITVMNPDELLAGLDDRFQLLSGGRRRSRQRTLEATLDWSYDLLTPEEQRVLRALGVFVDGFDLDAVAAVTNLDRRTATGHIETLQAKSLVVRADKRKATRFRLLETVKAYAEDRLLNNGEAEETRNRHLAHFHTLAMTEGRKVLGSLDVGLRLRHDCPNITTAYEWARDHNQWITAGELLTGSWSAYYLDVRFSEIRAALALVAVQVATLDPDLHGCINYQHSVASIMLTDVASAVAVADELTRSPRHNFRAIGWALIAWMNAFVAPENVDALLAKSAEERNTRTDSNTSSSNAHAHAEVLALWAPELVALMNGNFELSRDLSRELARGGGFVDAIIFVVSAAIADVMLGQPETALVTVAQLDEFDLPFMDGTEVRVLAHLALGNTDNAFGHLRRLATRAATGAYPGESDDAMLMFAALAHHQGDDDAARTFLLNAGQGRQPGTIAYGRHLARKLGIADAYLKQSQVEMGVVRSMNPLRTELTRRGWD
jgi:predicted ATPase